MKYWSSFLDWRPVCFCRQSVDNDHPSPRHQKTTPVILIETIINIAAGARYEASKCDRLQIYAESPVKISKP